MAGGFKPGVCKRCRAKLPGGARRCMCCGAQISTFPQADPREAARLERERLLRKYKLSEIQQQILAAAVAGGEEIFVCGNDDLSEGEVKSGEQRFYGNEAVVAVAALAGPGLISPQGEDCFRLTADGCRLAKTLELKPV